MIDSQDPHHGQDQLTFLHAAHFLTITHYFLLIDLSDLIYLTIPRSKYQSQNHSFLLIFSILSTQHSIYSTLILFYVMFVKNQHCMTMTSFLEQYFPLNL